MPMLSQMHNVLIVANCCFQLFTMISSSVIWHWCFILQSLWYISTVRCCFNLVSCVPIGLWASQNEVAPSHPINPCSPPQDFNPWLQSPYFYQLGLPLGNGDSYRCCLLNWSIREPRPKVFTLLMSHYTGMYPTAIKTLSADWPERQSHGPGCLLERKIYCKILSPLPLQPCF